MTNLPVTIPKQPALKPAEDYYRLRREGIGFIEQMGSRLWTDYNTHDPGITILEALCYAITDLAYRTGWDVKDILAPETAPSDPNQPYPNQAFFTARKILTVNPTTPDDFRRLLIDLDAVRNAWVVCKQCACDLSYYAWCEKDQLLLSHQAPPDVAPAPLQVSPRGLYDVLLELESDPELGDLNDRKIEHATIFHDANGAHSTIMELRFPEFDLTDRDGWTLFLDSDDAFAGSNGESFTLKLTSFGTAKTYDLFSDAALDEEGRNSYLRNHWRNVFYLSFEIELQPAAKSIVIENATLRLFSDAAAKNATTAAGLKTLFEDAGAGGFILRYRKKAQQRTAAVENAKAALHAHRNLDEDYCRVKVVGIEEVAVCADVEVKPDADVELVQARIWFEIEQYFNPPVPFYTLQELMDAGEAVEDIFNGPELESGFIKDADLQAASLKSVLRVSDIINRLMDIDGVIAVNQLQLTKYDSEGNVVRGAADPSWTVEGIPVFDANKISASWLLYVGEQHQPRLYLNVSRFLFYSNGLPFLPRMDEAGDTLIQLRGEAERPKNKNAPNDLPVPAGTFRNPEDYFPVQYSFPLTYGIGPEGLPSHAAGKRRAQARQLKAYLMVFEQFLGNAFAQIAHAADLFSLDPRIERTYFVREFSKAIIQGYDEITSGLDKPALEAMTETLPEFHERRNRFLDHLMARFGEQFSEYALVLTNLQGQQVALDRLIDDKISFLKSYVSISHDRGKAFNYKVDPCSPDNQPGLLRRIKRLLGFARSSFAWSASGPVAGEFTVGFDLLDEDGAVRMTGSVTVGADLESEAIQSAFDLVTVRMSLSEAYRIETSGGKFRTVLTGADELEFAEIPGLFETEADAEAAIGDLMLLTPRSVNDSERGIIVEHLLLRPKFPGDALYPVCSDGACQTCGDEDPYSFRLTFVMPGWTEPFNTNIEMRVFADRTIRQETPSHLLGKICWVGNDGFVKDPCDPILTELAQLLETKGLTTEGDRPLPADACDCAATIHEAFSNVFEEWYRDKTLDYFEPTALLNALETEFTDKLNPADISCTTVLEAALWAEIQALMISYFHHIALYGWQFERFEDAWCKWLEANTGFDWTEERLLERVTAILANNQPSDQQKLSKDQLCQCAAVILADFGMAFYDWMNDNFKAGKALDELTDFVPPEVRLCTEFNAGTAEQISELLLERYNAYTEVSFRLRTVLGLLSKLSNTYPAATLHDCDQGDDRNPVRLGQTALGS